LHGAWEFFELISIASFTNLPFSLLPFKKMKEILDFPKYPLRGEIEAREGKAKKPTYYFLLKARRRFLEAKTKTDIT